jgi:hypothetical protein
MKKIIREDTAAPPTNQIYATQAGPLSQDTRLAPTVYLEKKERPMIVKEHIMPTEKVEIQPVIHREREQLEVHEVYQPIHERDIAPTLIKHDTLPAQIRPDWRESDRNFQEKYQAATHKYTPETWNQPVQREVVNRAPIIEEHISRKIIEEVQPVLYKETIRPVVLEETQPIYERVIEAPTMFEETRGAVDWGVKNLPVPKGFISAEAPNLSTTSAQMNEMHLHEPYFHKETLVTKEVFIEPVNPKVETKHTT